MSVAEPLSIIYRTSFGSGRENTIFKGLNMANYAKVQAKLNRGKKMARAFATGHEIRNAIRNFFSSELKIDLPEDKSHYNHNRDKYYRRAELGNALFDRYDDLANYFYYLGIARTFIARFPGQKKQHPRNLPLAWWHSQHKLDPAFNVKKQTMLRGIYSKFFETATDEQGRNLREHYHPIHLVLTVPHPDGQYKGREFYAEILIKEFRNMRKEKWFKKYIWGGEYGLEVTRGKNGNHIHLHCLLLQHPEYSRNQVAEQLTTSWRERTGNDSSYSGVHYETLYYHQRGADGKKIKDQKGNNVKCYLAPGADVKHYVEGVMECIKYHFKPAALKKTSGEWDIELMRSVCADFKNLRMYDRFGGFYKREELSFNRRREEPESKEELPEIVAGEAAKAEENLINPWTLELAKPDDYYIISAPPLALKYYAFGSDYENEPFISEYPNPPDGVKYYPHTLPLGRVMANEIKEAFAKRK